VPVGREGFLLKDFDVMNLFSDSLMQHWKQQVAHSEQNIKLVITECPVDIVADDDMGRIAADDVYALLRPSLENPNPEQFLCSDEKVPADTLEKNNLPTENVVEHVLYEVDKKPWNPDVTAVALKPLSHWCKQCRLFLQMVSGTYLGLMDSEEG
jgi:hypothetical protein